MFSKLIHISQSINFSQLALKRRCCTICGFNFQIKLFDNEMGVRCLKCKASAVSQSLAQVFQQQTAKQPYLNIYEMASRGAWWRSLNRSHHQLTYSEYFDNIPSGAHLQGVQCQDVQQLSYADQIFNICTSLEVFEHV